MSVTLFAWITSNNLLFSLEDKKKFTTAYYFTSLIGQKTQILRFINILIKQQQKILSTKNISDLLKNSFISCNYFKRYTKKYNDYKNSYELLTRVSSMIKGYENPWSDVRI